MKTIKGIWALFILSSLATGAASAAFLFEPFIGYSTGKAEVGERLSPGDFNGAAEADQKIEGIDGKFNGPLLGAKIGVTSLLGFNGGFHYEQSRLDGKSQKKIHHHSWGFFVGYDLPILLRFSASYLLSSEWHFAGHSIEGSGYSLNLGTRYFSRFNIFTQYNNRTYDEFDDFTAIFDMSEKSYVLGISLPFSF